MKASCYFFPYIMKGGEYSVPDSLSVDETFDSIDDVETYMRFCDGAADYGISVVPQFSQDLSGFSVIDGTGELKYIID